MYKKIITCETCGHTGKISLLENHSCVANLRKRVKFLESFLTDVYGDFDYQEAIMEPHSVFNAWKEGNRIEDSRKIKEAEQ